MKSKFTKKNERTPDNIFYGAIDKRRSGRLIG